MGKRLYSHSKHVIEYSSSAFNWDIEEVNRIIFAFCPMTHGDDEDNYYDDELEVPVQEFEKMLSDIRNEDMRNAHIEEYCLEEPTSATWEETIENLQRLYDQADKSDGFVHLSWF